jgi:flagellar export protein FliJ
MSFQFPLAAVLRYREGIEQREHFALEKLQIEVAGVTVKIGQIEQECSTAAENRAAKLAQGMPAAELQFAYEYHRALKEQLDGFRKLLQELRMKWSQQLACYQLARRNRKTLEKLREKQLETYSRERAKREQAVLDDIFLSRRRRGN